MPSGHYRTRSLLVACNMVSLWSVGVSESHLGQGGGKVRGASLRGGKMQGTVRGRLWLVGG